MICELFGAGLGAPTQACVTAGVSAPLAAAGGPCGPRGPPLTAAHSLAGAPRLGWGKAAQTLRGDWGWETGRTGFQGWNQERRLQGLLGEETPSSPERAEDRDAATNL